jgi:predicted ester cyclase
LLTFSTGQQAHSSSAWALDWQPPNDNDAEQIVCGNGGQAPSFASLCQSCAAVPPLLSFGKTIISVSTPSVVSAFYDRIWNAGDYAAIPELLSDGITFRGSLGCELTGHKEFIEYVSSIRNSLSNYQCEILDCVTEGDSAFARMRFSGLHTGAFLGYRPTNKKVHWFGAALFRFERDLISDLWVLGDLKSLEEALTINQEAEQDSGGNGG